MAEVRMAMDVGRVGGDYTAKVWYKIVKGVFKIVRIRRYKVRS
jgi:hypothetical protein